MDAGIAATTAVHAQRNFVCASAHHDGIDVFPKFRHDLGYFFGPEKPVDCVVFTCNEIVEAVSASESHLAHRSYRSFHQAFYFTGKERRVTRLINGTL